MGLLGNGFEDPRSSAIMALAGGLLKGDFGGGLLGANQAYAQTQADALKKQLVQAQLEETQAQAAQRRAETQKEMQLLDRARRQQEALPSLFRQPGLTGGQAMPQEIGGVPMFSKPLQAAPMRQTPGGFDVQGAIAAGLTPEQIKAYASLNDIGRPEVARTVKGIGPDGREFEYQVDKFGQKVGDGLAQYRAPLSVNRGDRTTFADPYSLKPVGEFQTFQSPDNKASVGASYANAAASREMALATRDAAKINAGFKNETELRKEFADLPEVKRYKSAYPSFKAIQDAAASKNPQADINLIYGLAKLYDPESVVREGEYSTIANSQAIPEWLKGQAQQIMGGGRLTPETKRQILEQASNRIGAFEGEYDKARAGYTEIAKTRGIDPRGVFTEIGRQERTAPMMPKASGAVGPFSDPTKESRYQQWKRSQGQ